MKSALFSIFVFVLLSLGRLNQSFALEATYDQKVSVDGNAIATIKVSTKGELMKAESNFGGMITVMIRNASGTYSYLPVQKMATKIPASMDRPNLTRDLPHFMEFLQKNKGEKIGSEKVGTYETDVYKFVEPISKKDAKAWVWKEKSFPVKIEVKAPEGLTLVELSNINIGAKVDEASFQLPADTKIIDLEKTGPNAAAKAASEAVDKTTAQEPAPSEQ